MVVLEYNGEPPVPAIHLAGPGPPSMASIGSSVKVKFYTAETNPQKVVSNWVDRRGRRGGLNIQDTSDDISNLPTIVAISHTRQQAQDVLYSINNALQQETGRPAADVLSEHLRKADGNWQMNVAPTLPGQSDYRYMIFRSPALTIGQVRYNNNVRAVCLAALIVAETIANVLGWTINAPGNRAGTMNAIDILFFRINLWCVGNLINYAKLKLVSNIGAPPPTSSEIDDALTQLSASGPVPWVYQGDHTFEGIDDFSDGLRQRFSNAPTFPTFPIPHVPVEVAPPNSEDDAIQTA